MNKEKNSEVVTEAVLAIALRSAKVLAKMEDLQPTHQVSASKSRPAYRSKANRWYADEHGIVIHYPGRISVCDSDFREFHEIPYHHVQQDISRFCHTVGLHVTDKLVGLEIRRDVYSGKGYVFHREYHNLIYEWDDLEEYTGQMFLGRLEGTKEIFVNYYTQERNLYSEVYKITEDGEEEFVWCGQAHCRHNRGISPQVLQISERTVARYCYVCTKGSVQDVEDEEEEKAVFLLNWPEREMACIEHSSSPGLIAMVRKPFKTAEIKGVSVLHIVTGETELAFSQTDRERNICYCMSKEFIVISYRNSSEKPNLFTKFLINDRATDDTKEICVPDIFENMGSLSLISDSILVALPDGKIGNLVGNGFERVYTMDLFAPEPEKTVMSLKVPASEVRMLGQNRLICRFGDDRADHFQVYSLVPLINEYKKSEETKCRF